MVKWCSPMWSTRPTLVTAHSTLWALSRGEDDGCTLTDLKLQIIDNEVAEPSVEGFGSGIQQTQTFRHDSIAEGHAVCAVWRNGMVFK